MSDRPEPGEIDEVELLQALDRLLDEARSGARDEEHPGKSFMGAYAEANKQAGRHGNVAGLILIWLTAGWADAEALDAAHEVLHGESDDPRGEKLRDVVRRLAAGEMTWTEFAKVTKKGLIRREQPEPPHHPSPDAIRLSTALETLKTMLDEAGVSTGEPDPATVWKVFKAFAKRPVTATTPFYIDDDMCLFQWGTYDWGEGRHFEWDLTRQFVLYERDDDSHDYDHMEQMHVTLLFDPADPNLAALGTGDLWSNSALAEWIEAVERLDAFVIPTTADAVPTAMRVDHEHV